MDEGGAVATTAMFNNGPVSFVYRLSRALLFVVSAALASYALYQTPKRPWLTVAAAVTAAAFVVPPIIARRRFRKLLLSGDVERIVRTWRQALDASSEADPTEPLVIATAFAAYGWVEEARAQLHRIRWIPQEQSAIEHRMFVEALVEAFDGDRDHAVQIASRLGSLPVPDVDRGVQRKVVLIRLSLGALARAFARRSEPGDLELLEKAAKSSPLVSWAMRYAAAIVAVEAGQHTRAMLLLDGAPSWPPQSAFRLFHKELMDQLALPTKHTHLDS